MVQTFEDLLETERRSRGVVGVVGVWKRAISQIVVAAWSERFRADGASLTDRMSSQLRHALRSVRARPGFSATVVLVLGIGIGASTAVFSAVNGVLLSAMPYPEVDRLLYFEQGSHTPDEYLAWRNLDAFEQVAALQTRQRDLFMAGRPDVARVTEVNGSYFPLLGATPRLGRLIDAEDAVSERAVAVLSHAFWVDRLGADPDVLNTTLRLDDTPYLVVGVAHPVTTPVRINRGHSDVWTPLLVAPRDRGNIRVFGRVAEGVNASEAGAQVQAAVDELVAAYPDEYAIYPNGRRVPLVSIKAAELVDVELALYLIFGSVVMLLLIACGTVANLFLARTRDRGHEIAVRAALGGSRGTVVRQLVTESLILSAVGGMLGASLAWLTVQSLVAGLPAEVPRLETIRIDVTVLGFAAVLSLLAGLVFGLAPVVFTDRLEEGATRATDVASRAATRGWIRLRGVMVSSQIALALILLIGSGLLFNSFVHLLRVDPGFQPEGVVTAEVSIGRRYTSGAERIRFVTDVEQQLRRTPGVELVAHGLLAPFSRESGCCWWGPASTPGLGDSVRVHLTPASKGYMEALGVSILGGTDFPDWEPDGGEAVPLIVGTRLEATMFNGASAVGRALSIGNGGPRDARVVGVVEDMKFGDLSANGAPQVYMPYAAVADLHGSITFVAKRSESGLTGDAVREALWSVDPSLPVPSVLSLDANVDRSVAPYRLVSSLLLGFAAFALALAVVGTYGTVQYAVGRRRRELGVRLVLGATPSGLVSFAMRRGVALVAIGVIVGLGGASVLATAIESVVFGVTPWDPVTYLVLTTVIAGAALLACYLPARRAARVDPMETMRAE